MGFIIISKFIDSDQKMRQKFFAMFTIAAVAPFNDQGGNFAQAVSIRDQSQNPVASSLDVADESAPALAQY